MAKFTIVRQLAAKDELPKQHIHFCKSKKYSYKTSGKNKVFFRYGETTVWLSETIANKFYAATSAKEELLAVLRGEFVEQHRDTPKKGYSDTIYTIQAAPEAASKFEATQDDLDSAWEEA